MPVERFSLEKLDVLILHNFEICWGLLRPKDAPNSTIREIIVVSFYSPPKSRKKNKLLDHILTTIHILLTKYPHAGLIIGGDKNDLDIAPLIAGIPRVQQIVNSPTLNTKILDIILTNLHQLYHVPVVVPPVQPDDPNYGVPSDHSIPVATPLSNSSPIKSMKYETKTFQPMPESGIREFGQWVMNERWEGFPSDDSPCAQVSWFESILTEKMNEIFPKKTVKVREFDKSFITAELKVLDRRKKREYLKRGRSKKYIELSKKYERKFRKAGEQYLEKNVRNLKEADPSKAYSTLKRM